LAIKVRASGAASTCIGQCRPSSRTVRVGAARPFTAKKDFVWICNKDTKEQAFNDGRVVAIMRITDLKA
jgi:hypothetical protein